MIKGTDFMSDDTYLVRKVSMYTFRKLVTMRIKNIKTGDFWPNSK